MTTEDDGYEGDARRDKHMGRNTRLSPFSFVIFAGNPAGNACWKISIWPFLAASYILEARAMAFGGSSPVAKSILIVAKYDFASRDYQYHCCHHLLEVIIECGEICRDVVDG